MRSPFLVNTCLVLVIGLGAGADRCGSFARAADKPVSFSKQVAPILVGKCLACHGPRQPKSGYQLHTFEKLLQMGDFGEPIVVAGKPEESLLYQLVSSPDEDTWMPKEADRLADAQIALVRRWIAEGAKYDAGDKAALLTSIAPRVYKPSPAKYARPLPIFALAFHPQGTELAVAGYNEISIWDPAAGKLLRRIGNVDQRTYGLTYSPDGKLLAAASGTPGSSGEVKLFDPASGKVVRLLGTTGDVVCDVAFNPKGDKLAAAAADRSLRVYDVASGKENLIIEDHADAVMAVAWSADGKRLATASRDKTSKVFDAATGESQATYNGHGQAVLGVAFRPDGQQMLTAGEDKKIHLWNPADGKKAAEIAGYGHEVYRLAIVGGHIFSCSADKTARQHETASRKQVRSFTGHSDWVYCLAVHGGSHRLATGTYTGEVHLFDTADGKLVNKFFAAPGYQPPASGGR